MNWYSIEAKGETAQVWLYDEIGAWGIGAKDFIAELSGVKAKTIDLHVNSPGGEVFDGTAIYNALRRHPAKVTTYIDGLAASIASVIALAGDRVVAAANSLYMIHNPHGLVVGEAGDMRRTADLLDKVRETMVGTYAAKTKKGEDEIRALLDAESWFTAAEAVEAGFVDEVGEEQDLAACAKFVPILAKLGAQHVPNALGQRKALPSEREVERALRQAGCSQTDAKSILARGYAGAHRDGAAPSEPPQPAPARRDAGTVAAARRDKVAELMTRVHAITRT